MSRYASQCLTQLRRKSSISHWRTAMRPLGRLPPLVNSTSRITITMSRYALQYLTQLRRKSSISHWRTAMRTSTRSLRMFLDTLIALQQQQLLSRVLNRWRPMFCRMCSFIFLHKSQKPQMISLGMYRAAIICLSTKVRWTYRVGGKIYFYFRIDFWCFGLKIWFRDCFVTII